MNTITILDVGHGNSTVINDNGKICIVDTGDSSALIDYLSKKRIQTIEYLFLSHSDKDHIGKALQLLTNNSFTIMNIIANSDSIKQSNIWKDLVYEIEQHSNNNYIKLDSAIVNKEFQLGDTTLTINSPSPEILLNGVGSKTKNGEKITANTISMYITVQYKKINIIALSGDIDDVAIAHFSTSIINALTCKHLVFPHHGGYCKNINKYEELLKYVSPEYIIFSNGKQFKNNPRSEIIKIIKNTIPTVKILCTELSDLCKSCDNQMQCAGDITIDMETNSIISPILTTYENQKNSYLSKIC